MSINPKYRRLTVEELQSLEKEFIDFLVVNGIVAEDWEKMKKEDLSKAEDIITLFSDSMLEGALRKTIFLEFKDSQTIKCFQCLQEKIVLIGLDGTDEFDLTNKEKLRAAVANPPEGFKIYTTDKKYSQPRELEMFKMIQSGSYISDGSLFKTLGLALEP